MWQMEDNIPQWIIRIQDLGRHQLPHDKLPIKKLLPRQKLALIFSKEMTKVFLNDIIFFILFLIRCFLFPYFSLLERAWVHVTAVPQLHLLSINYPQWLASWPPGGPYTPTLDNRPQLPQIFHCYCTMYWRNWLKRSKEHVAVLFTLSVFASRKNKIS